MIHLVQYLCENRHCIIAAGYDPEATTLFEVKESLLIAAASAQLETRCGICGSEDMHFEDAETGYRTMEEADAPFKAAEMKNLISRMVIEAERSRNN